MAEPRPDDAIPDFTPVSLLTGFLGSGKTTLLRRLLDDPALADTAVLINEFGEVGLDHHLIDRIDETTVLLQSGCVCCTIRGELSEAIRGLHSKRAQGAVSPFRRLVIESTGLADPFPIVSTVRSDPVLRHHFRLANVITTVDAANGLGQLDTHEESLRQAAVADHLVITKTDITTRETIDRLLSRLAAINPAATVTLAAEEVITADRLLLAEPFDRPARADIPPPGRNHAHHHHDDRIRAFAVVIDRPIDWTAFGIWLAMLLNRHGRQVLRVKGIINVAGEPNPVAVHGVQHVVHPPVHMRAWPDGDRRSRIVFIVDGLDPALIRRSLDTFNRLSGRR
ncbi:G3E family GTPase [Tepidamorphus gemmatus]|uniref:G3E family GTPase n=1 Tax=Tepidamorphus gemmatus TaxID=747076 RepID=A0A4R3M4H2_9HYPH|nr:GTP-binding protein [Tepidamorphus gemmatus]TCT07159.1 G3E family GTPase [Tepidamorphus gemmatus]